MTRAKSPMLYHSSASVLLMRKTTNILEQAYLALHWPEQLNPMDPSAIDLDYGTGWTHVGYLLLNYASICTH